MGSLTSRTDEVTCTNGGLAALSLVVEDESVSDLSGVPERALCLRKLLPLQVRLLSSIGFSLALALQLSIALYIIAMF